MSSEIIEGNKLIAEFMGLLSGKPQYPFTKPNESVNYRVSQYHTSWDWLMPVVKNIADLMLNKDWEDDKPLNEAIARWRPIANELEKINLENVWYCVVKFITWYNNQSKQEIK